MPPDDPIPHLAVLARRDLCARIFPIESNTMNTCEGSRKKSPRRFAVHRDILHNENFD